MTEVETLTIDEHSALVDCEAVIERGLKSFVEVGQALLRVRDARLYRAEHLTFKAYLAERWGMSEQRGYQIMEAASVTSKIFEVAPELPPPSVESHAAALARVPEEQRAEIWQKVVETTDGKPTAAAIRDAVSPPLRHSEPVWGTPESRTADVVQCNMGEHIALRTTFEAVDGCPYCLHTPGERIAAVNAVEAFKASQKQSALTSDPFTLPQVEPPTAEEAQRIEEFRRGYDAAEPDRDLVRRQRVATDLIDRHVYNLSLIGESVEVANYTPDMSANPITHGMLDQAEVALRHIRKSLTERGIL